MKPFFSALKLVLHSKVITTILGAEHVFRGTFENLWIGQQNLSLDKEYRGISGERATFVWGECSQRVATISTSHRKHSRPPSCRSCCPKQPAELSKKIYDIRYFSQNTEPNSFQAASMHQVRICRFCQHNVVIFIIFV